jgi:hypothetical protein
MYAELSDFFISSIRSIIPDSCQKIYEINSDLPTYILINIMKNKDQCEISCQHNRSNYTMELYLIVAITNFYEKITIKRNNKVIKKSIISSHAYISRSGPGSKFIRRHFAIYIATQP